MLEKLIGAQILSVDNDCIIIKKGDKVFELVIMFDNGVQCGYADFTTNLLYSPNDLINPVITNIEREDGEDFYQDSSIITFFGESKPLATIESNVGSENGFRYGAFVSIYCKAMDIDETLASW